MREGPKNPPRVSLCMHLRRYGDEPLSSAAAAVIATAAAAAAVVCAYSAAAANENKNENEDPGAVASERVVTHITNLLFLFSIHTMPSRVFGLRKIF